MFTLTTQEVRMMTNTRSLSIVSFSLGVMETIWAVGANVLAAE